MTTLLPLGWRRVRLGDVVEQVNRFERVKPDPYLWYWVYRV
jgi:hypothetical protein